MNQGLTPEEATEAAATFVVGLPLGMIVIAALVYWWSQH